VAKWIDKPGLSAGQLADGDKVLIGDVSQAVGSRDKTVTLGDLRAFLGAGVTVAVTQASHGLAVGDVIRHNGTSYVAATADTSANAEAVGIVTTVPDVDSFTYQAAGFVTGLSGLTAGELYYLQDDGSLGTTPGTVEKAILIAVSSTSGVMVLAVGASGGASAFTDLSDTPSDYTGSGGKFVAVKSDGTGLEFADAPTGASPYDLQLGFAGAPGAGAADVVLAPRAVTIDDADPGEVYVGTNPTDGTATIDIQVNGVSVGGIDITTGGVVTWDLSADIQLNAGDTLALVAPSPADSTLADVIVALKGIAS
jgi:hypothetical protein